MPRNDHAALIAEIGSITTRVTLIDIVAGEARLINHVEVALDQFVGLNADSIGKGREYTEFDTRALLRSAFKDRIDGLARAVQGGIYSPNEARRLEGLPEAEDGDEPRVQQQVVPLSFATTPPEPPPAPPSPVSPVPVEDQADKPVPDDEETAALTMFHLQREMSHVRAAA